MLKSLIDGPRPFLVDARIVYVGIRNVCVDLMLKFIAMVLT